MSDKFYVYILECADKSLYTGYTVDLDKRLRAHNEGSYGAKYTRTRRPCRLVYWEEYSTKHEAMSREAGIKMLNRKQKLSLISDFKGNTVQ